jgi:hypothetical protein
MIGTSAGQAVERINPADKYVEPIFYLSAKPGCYDVTPSRKLTVAALAYKRLFKRDCSGKHLLEVFFKGEIKDSPKNSWQFCQDKSKSFRFSGRKSGMYNWTFDEFLIASNYFPDPGPETSRFRDVVICYVAVTVEGNRLFKEVDRPLVLGKK